jgi:hypothetical protein
LENIIQTIVYYQLGWLHAVIHICNDKSMKNFRMEVDQQNYMFKNTIFVFKHLTQTYKHTRFTQNMQKCTYLEPKNWTSGI